MYNATNEHWIKVRKEGKPRGNKTPRQKIMYQKKKMTTSRKLCSSLQDDPAKSKTSAHWKSSWRCRNIYGSNEFLWKPVGPCTSWSCGPIWTWKYSFQVEVELDSKSGSVGLIHTPFAWVLFIMDFPQPYCSYADQ